MNKLGLTFLSALCALSLNCGGCDSSGIDNNGTGDNAATNGTPNGTPNGTAQCTGGEPITPCGNCDQDCRPGGNPFAPGASGGDQGFDGDTCTTDTDCKGTCGDSGACEGFGSGGFTDETCTTDADCRGVCDGTNTCEGFGVGTGYDGDRCLTDVDCRGECGGTGVCEGGGIGTTIPANSGTGTNSGTGANSGTGGGTDQNTCLDLDIDLQHAIPTISLVVDQSGSTAENFGNGLNRLEAAYTALMDPTDGLIQEVQGAFRIGLSLYTSFSDDVTCPEIADVRPELNNFEPINRVFSLAEPEAGTPTGEAILGTLRQFDVHPEQGRKILMLATDGEPNTCQDPYNDVGQPEALAAAQQAYQQGIETIVLSVGDGVGRSHLEDMANAGAGLPIGGAQQAPYYEAQDPTQLKAEMRTIIESARSCIFRVKGGVIDPTLVDQATVTLDGMVLGYGDANGWNYHQDRVQCEGAKQCVTLEGNACTALQDGGDHSIQGNFLCSYYDPENPPIIPVPNSGSGGNNGGGENGMPGPCITPGGSCSYDGDCCSGVCGGGTCITQ